MSSSGPQQEVGPGMRLGGPQPKYTPLLYQCFLVVEAERGEWLLGYG